jgi:hypothetical protein
MQPWVQLSKCNATRCLILGLKVSTKKTQCYAFGRWWAVVVEALPDVWREVGRNCQPVATSNTATAAASQAEGDVGQQLEVERHDQDRDGPGQGL